MSRSGLGTALALSWCDLWALVAAPDDGARRREEFRAHVADARSAGVGGWRLAGEALCGGVDDVRWCNESRLQAGRPSLALAVLVERDMAVVVMAALMVVVFIVSLFPALHALGVVLVAAAGGLLVITASRLAQARFLRARRARD